MYCRMQHQQDRTCWEELDDDLIYYRNDISFHPNDSHLKIRNTQVDKTMEYFNIVPGRLRLLNKQNSYRNLFIEVTRSTIIAKLDKISLNLKIDYRICYSHRGLIFDLNNMLHLELYNKGLVQMFKNKLIRKYKGKLQQILGHDIMTRMGLKSFNSLRHENYKLFWRFQCMFEKQFKFSLRKINEQYGRHVIKKLGDFLVLKKDKYQQINAQLPVYYLSIDIILKGDGMKGKIQLGHDESLKMIKCFNNLLYLVIKQGRDYKVQEIRGINNRETVYSVSCQQCFIWKPILFEQHLIFTNSENRLIPQEHEIENKRNKNEIK